mmetsp:Transcript_51753/g.129911  ORF Transcript_51753/g.129911 Transcript_51753/m.129911 type:complete len:515 (-) Transcript_51753:971-2515(-)
MEGKANVVEFSAEACGPPEILPEEIEYFEKIGGGCFGHVYRGKCRGKEVAVKRLFKQDLNEKSLADFKREVEICSRLHHPNILLFMGACTVPGHMAIVTELMPKGNLQALLHDPKAELSLLFRMRMAKDIALGMNWLHRSQPQIIHRDLKPSNLLIDEYRNVKVCDFGLSAVKTIGTTLQDKDSIPGTPLWMAPEVLMGKPLDEKADVYSFAIVMWEMVAQEEPFPEFESYREFRQAICFDNVRPPLTCPPLKQPIPASIRHMMQAAWHKDPPKRPSFDVIIQMFDSVLVDCSVSDSWGNQFWKTHFFGKAYCFWPDFVTAFRKHAGMVPHPEDDIEEKCLKACLAEVLDDPTLKNPPQIVQCEAFGRFLQWFGPVDPEPAKFTQKIVNILSQKWFHGEISKDQADDLLNRMKGRAAFLVRLSTTKAGQFTISKINNKGKINHQRIDYQPGVGFSLKVMNPRGEPKTIQSNDPLPRFIEMVRKELKLKNECSGSRFESLFAKEKKEDTGYTIYE